MAVAAVLTAGTAFGAGISKWVYFQGEKLTYKPSNKGDRIMDFSSAGYGGGGVKIPAVPVVKTISPSGGKDDSPLIQSAIDEVSKRDLVKGFRGAVLLKAGTYNCGALITIKASGVVLRGEGSGASGTIIKMIGKPHQAIAIEGAGKMVEVGPVVKMKDAYVPSGTTIFSVENAGAFKTGDTVLIYRPATEKWVHFMGMDKLVRNGKDEHWVSGDVRTERVIAGVQDGKIALDVPLTDSFDAQYINPPGGRIVKYEDKGRITQVGVEDLRITAPPNHVAISEALYTAIRMTEAADAWVRSVEIVDTTDAVAVSEGTTRVTVEDVGITHTTTTVGGAKPADYSASGTEVLFNKCRDKGDDVFYFVTGPRVTGPIVLLNCVFQGGGWIQPHQRWATGLLVDTCQCPTGGIELMDRGIMGSGHGWTIGWSVAWNCSAKSFEIEQPPGSVNWAIGCRGAIDKSDAEPGSKAKMPEGFYDSQGTAVTPASLYLEQLTERLGPAAAKNIGY